MNFGAFNKATAAAISGAVVAVLGSVFSLSPEVQGGIQTVITFLLVIAIPNKG